MASERPARATVLLLAVCYALSLSTVALNVAIAPIVGLSLAPRPALATLPVSLQVLATMLASFPVAMVMGRFGRRAGHYVTTLVGLLGAGVSAAAVVRGDFVLFCVGATGLGVLNSAAQQYRFAAAEVADRSWQPRAISYVMAGGLVAGVLGPAIAVQGADAMGVRFAGSYLAAVVLFAVVAMIVATLRLTRPAMDADDGPARGLGKIMRQPRFVAAVMAAMMAYGGMVLIMTGTPIAMAAEGFALPASARVIQLHVLAMFAPSFFVGRLIGRYGERRIIAAGIGCFMLTLAVALAGRTWWHHAITLVSLGLGWNLMFTAGTTMVTTVYRPAEKAKVQGVNELLVFGAAAIASFMAGYLHDAAGWVAMNTVLVPIILLAGVAWWLARTPAAQTVA